MSEHTKGRLRHYHGKLRPEFPTVVHEIYDMTGTSIVKWGGFDGVDLPKKIIAANARRLVACWNACNGLSTTTLESVIEGKESIDYVTVKRDRDELIEALHSLADEMADSNRESPQSMRGSIPGWIKTIHALLAKHAQKGPA